MLRGVGMWSSLWYEPHSEVLRSRLAERRVSLPATLCQYFTLWIFADGGDGAGEGGVLQQSRSVAIERQSPVWCSQAGRRDWAQLWPLITGHTHIKHTKTGIPKHPRVCLYLVLHLMPFCGHINHQNKYPKCWNKALKIPGLHCSSAIYISSFTWTLSHGMHTTNISEHRTHFSPSEQS